MSCACPGESIMHWLIITVVVNQLDTTLAALAEPTRRHVVELLLEQPRRAGDLAAEVGTSAPAMSRHLRVLRTLGLVVQESVEEDARVHLYRLRPDRFLALQAWLDRMHAFWADQLGAYQKHVERTKAGDRSP